MPSLEIVNAKAADSKAKAGEVTAHDFSPSIPAAAQKIKDTLLAEVEKMPAIVNSEAQAAPVVATLRKIKDVIKEVSLTRKSLAAPFQAICKELIAKEEAFLAELETAKAQLLGLANNWEQRKLAKGREEEAARQKQAQQSAQAAQELSAKAAELQQQAATATGKTKQQLEDEALDLQIAAMTKDLEAAPVLNAIVGTGKTTGFSAKEFVEYEVTDAIVFCQAYPEFFVWKPEDQSLKLQRRELLEELAKPKPNKFWSSPFPEEQPDTTDKRALPNPPGLRLFWAMRSRVS